jgi:flagellar biosynthesis protein FlhA
VTAAPRTGILGRFSDGVGGIALFGVLALTVVPLPPAVLDLLLAASLCASILVFLVALYVDRPLEFSAFPSLLLFVTLFRLALNVASTRIILLRGQGGHAAAGGVIRAFGEFAVGGNFVVGAVVFLILVIVNYIVITKGADRISEVGARFTLDAMPGKQMAIDAELGAGAITEREARQRRKEIELEADFHGAMDGASKFVRGDAVAGLLIVAVNIIAGMIVGVAQHGLSFGDAAKTYTTLSIGDGLVSQLPALMVSTGAALLSTRGSAPGPLGHSLATQLLSRRAPVALAAAILGILALIPGMPHLAFLSLSAVTGFVAYRSGKGPAAVPGAGAAPAADDEKAPRPDSPAAQKAEIETLLPVELLTLEVGLDLLPLVDGARHGELLGRIASLRKQMAVELGFIVPPVHVRDDLRLRPGGYRILVSGAKVASGEVRVSRLLAIDPDGRARGGLVGESVHEPTFGLPALWIAPADRPRAESAGLTVVDASAVVATHLTEIVRRHAHELLGRREAQELMELAAKHNAKVVEELIPHILPLGEVIKVLRTLLREGVSIRDIRSILETLADNAAQVKDPGELAEHVRVRLGRSISQNHLADNGELRALVLDPRAEELLRQGGRGQASPQALSRLASALEDAARAAAVRGDGALVIVAPDVRRALSAIAQRHVPGLVVLSYREVDPSVPVITRAVVSLPAAEGPGARAALGA